MNPSTIISTSINWAPSSGTENLEPTKPEQQAVAEPDCTTTSSKTQKIFACTKQGCSQTYIKPKWLSNHIRKKHSTIRQRETRTLPPRVTKRLKPCLSERRKPVLTESNTTEPSLESSTAIHMDPELRTQEVVKRTTNTDSVGK